MRTIFAVAVLALVVGCATGPTPEEIAAADHARCTEYGYPAGHPEYGNCRLALDQQRLAAIQAEAARKAAIAQVLGASAMVQQSLAPPPAAAPAAPTNCYTNSMGVSCW